VHTVGDDTFEDRLRQATQRYMSAPAESLRLADEALALLGEAAPVELRVRARMVRGNALAYDGRFAESLAALQTSLSEVPPAARVLRTQVLRALAFAYHEMGAADATLHYALQAVDAARDGAEPALLADVLLTLGVAVSSHGDAAGGLRHYEEVVAIYESLGDTRGMIHALNNIGIACKNLGRHEEALAALARALALAEEHADAGAAAVVASNLGEPLWRLGRLAEARAAMHDAAQRLVRSGYANGETHARILLGELLHADGEPAQAQAELERALALAHEHGATSHTARAHKVLADLHKAAGRFEQALRHHEAFHEAEQARFKEDSHRKLRALQVQADLERAQREAERARLQLAALAAETRTDALTRLSNRRHLDERLAEEFVRARRQGHGLALAMADIDDFKAVNDVHGHATGDVVLRTVAGLLREHCRAIDLVARYGGEEFCIVFLDATGPLATRACEAMRAAVAGHDWAALRPGMRVTLSIGLADGAAHADAAALLAAADAQLYEAKRRGKNRVHPPRRPPP